MSLVLGSNLWKIPGILTNVPPFQFLHVTIRVYRSSTDHHLSRHLLQLSESYQLLCGPGTNSIYRSQIPSIRRFSDRVRAAADAVLTWIVQLQVRQRLSNVCSWYGAEENSTLLIDPGINPLSVVEAEAYAYCSLVRKFKISYEHESTVFKLLFNHVLKVSSIVFFRTLTD